MEKQISNKKVFAKERYFVYVFECPDCQKEFEISQTENQSWQNVRRYNCASCGLIMQIKRFKEMEKNYKEKKLWN